MTSRNNIQMYSDAHQLPAMDDSSKACPLDSDRDDDLTIWRL